MLVELLEPAGPDLARRWLAALLLVDSEDRPALVAELERRVAASYAPSARSRSDGGPDEPGEIHVINPPVQRDGFVEQVITTYARVEPAAAKPAKQPRRGKRA